MAVLLTGNPNQFMYDHALNTNRASKKQTVKGSIERVMFSDERDATDQSQRFYDRLSAHQDPEYCLELGRLISNRALVLTIFEQRVEAANRLFFYGQKFACVMLLEVEALYLPYSLYPSNKTP